MEGEGDGGPGLLAVIMRGIRSDIWARARPGLPCGGTGGQEGRGCSCEGEPRRGGPAERRLGEAGGGPGTEGSLESSDSQTVNLPGVSRDQLTPV